MLSSSLVYEKMDEDVAGEILRKIKEMEQGYEQMKLQMSTIYVPSRSPPPPPPRPYAPRFLLPEDEDGASRAARAMDKRCMNIMQSMGQSVHVLDCNYRVVYWGVNSVKLFGYSRREAIGKSIIELAIGEEDRAAAKSIISKVYRGESWTGIFPCRNKWGVKLLILATNTPLYDDYGVLVGETCMACDSKSFEQVLEPAVNEQTQVVSRFSKLRNKTASTFGIDPEQPLQAAIISRISNLASRISLKVGNKIWSIGAKEKTSERFDNDINHSNYHLSSTTLLAEDTSLGRARISSTTSSSYGVFFELQTDRKLHGNLFGNFDDKTEVASVSQKWGSSEKVLLFGNEVFSQRKAAEFGLGRRSKGGESQAVAIYKKTSGSCSSLFSGTTVSKSHSSGSTGNSRSCGSTSSSYILGVDIDPDFADYEISWEHLTVGAQIGQGSCGTVYHAQWYGSDVAVKVFSNQEFSDDLISSFRKELSIMKRLRHPNILLFMGAITVGGNLCLVTEYLPRGSLFQLLRKKTMKLDWRRRINMAIDVAQGMNYLHHSNPPVVHRDLKSSNLLVDKNWNVKVGDFGLSRVKFETYLLTKTGKGTPQWMAPESLRHEPSDEKSDIYSYGVILWELATGKVPWADLNPMQVIGVVGFKNQRLEIPSDMEPQWALLIENCWQSDITIKFTKFQSCTSRLFIKNQKTCCNIKEKKMDLKQVKKFEGWRRETHKKGGRVSKRSRRNH